jgi:hypothetical protein
VDPSDIHNETRRALKLPGVQQCRVSHLQQTLSCVGGIQVTFYSKNVKKQNKRNIDCHVQIFNV